MTDGKLVHAGQVGTGFNDKSLKEIYSQHRTADHQEKSLSPAPSKRCAMSPG